jgi:UDP-N-acetylmuramate--alanine ligase
MAINSVFKDRHKKIHLVGIGGIGISGIARVLLESGFQVSGSDMIDGLEQRKLQNLGAQVFLGHHEDHVGNADILVYSSAVKRDNPELKQAEKNNIPIIPRAVMLAELMRLRCGIAVSGAHGKTTTTSLISTLMHKMGLDPTVIIGGIVNHFDANAVVGKSQFMVTEADESDGTFLHLSPTIAVVTNIDAEHLDFYLGGINEIKEKFKEFLESLPFYGLAVVCFDDPHIKEIISSLNRRISTYGLGEGAIYRAVNIETHGFTTTFDLLINNNFIQRFTINMVGFHNVLNSLAAIAVLEEVGVSAHLLSDVLRNFNGVKRRFTPICANRRFFVIDDYAHHPTEIQAVLKAARASFPMQKIRVLFQPHRFSRTKDLMREFAASFTDCDSLVVTEIYGANEPPIDGVTSEALVHCITSKTGLEPVLAHDIYDGAEKIVTLTEETDVVLTLGAGSITYAAPMIVDLLEQKYGMSHES